MNEPDIQTTPTPQSPFRGTFKLFFLGSISAVAYFYIFLLSGNNLRPDSADPWYLDRFLYTYAFLFGCYLWLILPLIRGQVMDLRHVWFGIAFGLLFRAIMLPSDLILENDIYRYMWDGHMSVNGINPYEYPPSHPATHDYRTEYWSEINYPYIPTIYPPTLQYVFLCAELIYPGSELGMKLFLTMFDVAAIFLLFSLLEKLKLPREWILIYAWSPLVIKEIANSGHADSVTAFLLTGVMWLIVQNRIWFSSAIMAGLTLTKFFSVFLLPLFHRFWHWKNYGLFLLIVIILYIPYIELGVNPFIGLQTYSKEWQFNAGLYSWVFDFFNSTEMNYEQANLSARLSLFIVLLVVILWQVLVVNRRKTEKDLFHAFFIVIGTLLICSPVIDPWYLVWIVPLLTLFPNRAWLMFTGLVFLSYIYYYNKMFPEWVKPVEFGIFYFLLIWDFIAGKISNWKQGRHQPSSP